MANGPGIVVKDRKDKTCVLMGVAAPTDRNVTAKGSREETKVQEFMYRDTANVEHEMYDYACSYCGLPE